MNKEELMKIAHAVHDRWIHGLLDDEIKSKGQLKGEHVEAGVEFRVWELPSAIYHVEGKDPKGLIQHATIDQPEFDAALQFDLDAFMKQSVSFGAKGD